mmetsp:Transcript_15912/g.40427  ORF Transcript_15912/g.40427 Transcript_15912/m.40427 type:complete len:248 (-) Transcript_15912:145-888(-)
MAMPSCTSTSVSSELLDSMDSTPSAPTLSSASAIILPMDSSLPAEMAATALIWSKPFTGREFSFSLPSRKVHVLSMPRLTATGLAPLVTTWMPYLMISAASTHAVVVPSPAASLVRPATSLMSWAPAFSTGSCSSMARAMDTPSLITCGTPKSCCSTTLRPRGPRVTPTARASLLMPRCILARESASKAMSLASARAAIRWARSGRALARRRPLPARKPLPGLTEAAEAILASERRSDRLRRRKGTG